MKQFITASVIGVLAVLFVVRQQKDVPPPHPAMRKVSVDEPGLSAKEFPYSVVRGGVHNAKEAQLATTDDGVVKLHYAGIDTRRLEAAAFKTNVLRYVSYRVSDQIYWTAKQVTIRAGEPVLCDGRNFIRARCGNRISEHPMQPTRQNGPSEDELDTPVAELPAPSVTDTLTAALLNETFLLKQPSEEATTPTTIDRWGPPGGSSTPGRPVASTVGPPVVWGVLPPGPIAPPGRVVPPGSLVPPGSPVGPPVAPPEGPPVSPPVGPPVAPPEGPPVSPPVAPPVVPPVSPPVSPPVAPPVSPPVAPPVSPPVAPPVAPPVGPPVSPPVSPPVAPPVSPPVSPPVGPPVSPPVSPPVGPPVSPPVAPPVSPPVAPPVSPPVAPPVGPPVVPPEVPPTIPPVVVPTGPPIEVPINPLIPPIGPPPSVVTPEPNSFVLLGGVLVLGIAIARIKVLRDGRRRH